MAMTGAATSSLLPGMQVLARGLTWEVVHSEPAGLQTRCRLRCLQGDLRGWEVDFLHPFEAIEALRRALDPAKAGRLTPWLLYHQAFLLDQALGPKALLAAQPGRLKLAPYQLVPVMRALQTTRPRLLLADGVGLGKTVQAGLILSELIARRRAHRILILSPAGPLLVQWQTEMRGRFGLRFEAMTDWATLQESRRSLEMGANPFDHVGLCIASIDFAKQEKVLQDLERASWDVAVIDEAHHCVRMGNAGDREDSLRRRLAEVIARQSDGLLLLTATPHDGYDPHFASLLELLDPSLVDGRGGLRGELYRSHVVRRLKQHVKDPKTGDPLFPERKVMPCRLQLDPAVMPATVQLHTALMTLVAPRLRTALRQRRYGDVLAFVALLKRSVSTVAACRNTLRTIRDRFVELTRSGAEQQEARRQRLRTLLDYRRRLERYGALSWEEEQDSAALEAEDMAAELFSTGADELVDRLAELRREQQREARREQRRLDRNQEIRAALDALVALADAAEPEDPKLAGIVEALRSIRGAEPHANVLVYTEYSDSQQAVVDRLNAEIAAGRLSGVVLQISGPDPEKVRIAVTERFAQEDDLILVSTDATAEGLNLQQRCHHLVHVELPYNPNRIEQRNGRIDRFGQTVPPQIRYLYLAATFEERLLLRLLDKFERQRQRLTFVPNTLGMLASDTANSTVKLLEGLAEEEGLLFRITPATVRVVEGEREDTTSPAYRDLLDEVDRAMAGYESAARTHAWLGDAGLNAEARLVSEADAARNSGASLGHVDLLRFVCNAVEAEAASAEAVVRQSDGTIALTLPQPWTFGLDDLPGYDPTARILRLTTNPDQLRDAEGRSVGYLGRAHPIVRRALDRVRNQQFGHSGGQLDRRVSAVRWDGSEPGLLFTFLAAVTSAAGREYERVIAVQVARDGTLDAGAEPERWEALANPKRQLPTANVWERHFAGWSGGMEDRAEQAAAQVFAPLAEEFAKLHAAEIARERDEIDRWLSDRADTLCGRPVAQQASLFEAAPQQPRWQTLASPVERLAAFHTDASMPLARRREAEGVLTLRQGRNCDLQRRAELQTPEPALLGMLMLVPEGG
jgi:ERCC4-related helicase